MSAIGDCGDVGEKKYVGEEFSECWWSRMLVEKKK